MSGREMTEASVSPDRYDELLRLADLFEATGDDLRARARLGVEVLGDDDVAGSEELSSATYAVAADAADEDDRALRIERLGELGQLRQRHVASTVDAPGLPLVGLAHVDQVGVAACDPLGGLLRRQLHDARG